MKPSVKSQIYDMLPPRATKTDCARTAAVIGCSMSTVYDYAAMFGRLGPRWPRLLPPVCDMIEVLTSGVRPTAIAVKAGVKPPAVYRALSRGGYRLRDGAVSRIEEVA